MIAALPATVTIREVGPRDGLQGETPLAPAQRARLVTAPWAPVSGGSRP